jgi:hypothetical protein
MAVAWQCPDGLTFDSVSRYAGCNISIGFAQFIGWSFVFLWPPTALLIVFTAAKLRQCERNSSAARAKALGLQGIGMLMVGPMYCSAAWDPHTPASSDRALSLAALLALYHLWLEYTSFFVTL